MKTEQGCVGAPTDLREVKSLLQKCKNEDEDVKEKQDELKYADLELEDVNKSGVKEGKDCGSEERNEMSLFVNSGNAGDLSVTESNNEFALKNETGTEQKEETAIEKCVNDDPSREKSLPDPSSLKSEDCPKSGDLSERVITQQDASRTEEQKSAERAEDNYLSGRSESDDFEEDDDVSLVLSDDCLQCVTEDESHYITTHEIQLTELSDHEGDYDIGVGSSASWELEDDNQQLYSFVDYASFDGDGAATVRAQNAAAHESDPSDAAKFTSSDESVSKQQQGQIHLSIRATSRAINDPSNIQEQKNILYHARRAMPGDMSRYVIRGVDGKAETLCDTAKCFIAAPGRMHFGKLRGKEVTEYSSGASSAVSELDDADKEVRNLTAKAFKSLAYPYFDAINFSTSSESSASEHGLGINRWSTFVDLKYGNMSQGLDQSVVSHQNSYEIAKNVEGRGYKGLALPTNKIFTLNGNPQKKIELMGKFSQSHSGVIRLTETLNFRCNVKSGMSAGERRTNFAQNAAGSRSTDEVTNSLPSSQRRGASKPPSNTMEGTHKKAIFASSLIKNVISKKMQFEQERKMERGEICEPHQTPPPSTVHQGSRELHRQSSRFSESSSDYAIMCVDELGDIVDSGSCDTKSDSRRQDAPETNLEPTNEAGIDTKKGALLRSQNSAFRCWKDEEVEFQKDHKNDKTQEERLPSASDKEGEGDPCSSGRNKLIKMSHLFVPSIQLLPSDGEGTQQLQRRSYSPCEDGAGVKVRSDNTLYIQDSRSVATSKSPEIKINLRSVRDNKTEPFSVSKLRAPNIGCNPASLVRTDDFKCQALAAALKGECSDKVPHFMVRDIRDNKGKLQTPIHQVRDVRKLVKSSYHFVSLDNNENKNTSESHTEQKKQIPYRNLNSVSPIVIKCQSVNTNSNGKQEIPKRETLELDRSSPEGAIAAPVQKTAGRAPLSNTNNTTEAGIGLRIESKVAPKRQEKPSDVTDKKPESKMANQVALEKLQAAVKTMEQLYVFERNEWKRKNEPQPLMDSHVLSLITSEEHGGPEEEDANVPSNTEKIVRRDSYPNADKTPPAVTASPSLPRREVFQTPSREDKPPAKSMQTTPTGNANAIGSKNMFSLSSSMKPSTSAKTTQPSTATQTPFSPKSFTPKSPKLPVSLKVSQTKLSGHEAAESREAEKSMLDLFGADNENYLTIPVKSPPSANKPVPSSDKTSVYTFSTKTNQTTPSAQVGSSVRGQDEFNQPQKRASIAMETRSPEIPPATIYHSLPLGMSPNQPQVYCFSPAITPAPTLDPFQTTQRKMLLDPTTGNYYLVDTPVQPTTKRLFDPETGQYVDVPMPQPPMTPVPMPISPLALSPGAYGHTYMIYPGFMPTPSVIPARTLVQSQMSVQSETEAMEKASSQQMEGLYMESPFYMATGKSPQAVTGIQQQAGAAAAATTAASRPMQGFSGAKQPVISITSQQGPRIIAPPSFDGTTMSFVVEHR